MAKPLKETSKKRLFADKIEEAATVDAKPLGREPNKGDAMVRPQSFVSGAQI